MADQTPPVSADPQPTATEREKLSVASAWPTAPAVTDWVAALVAPLLSVTVSVTVYVPALAYAWVAVAPAPAEVPSPQSQRYEATVPSGSLEAVPSTLTVAPETVAVNAALGFWFPVPSFQMFWIGVAVALAPRVDRPKASCSVRSRL